MSSNIESPITRLPVELLIQIFDRLDVETLLFSIRNVCRLFRSIITNYDQYILNLTLISKSSFYRLCRIPSENVISLILSNNERTSDQIDLFLSLVHLQQFTRLRSLTLLGIDEIQLTSVLEGMNLDVLTSFSFNLRKYNDKFKKTTLISLSSLLALSTLRNLQFGMKWERLPQIIWPQNCTIQHLTINNSIPFDNLCQILQCSPYLHTLNLNTISTETIEPLFSFCFPQITSLTIRNVSITVDELELFLSLMPSLVYLKLIGGKNMFDGKRWEQFLDMNLPHLNKFEFYFNGYMTLDQTVKDLQLIIAGFQTSFWIEEKKWFVVCEGDIDELHRIDLYSIPICKSDIYYYLKSKNISLSTHPTMIINDNQFVMDNVKSLTFTWDNSTADDLQQQSTSNCPLFPKVTEVNLEIRDNWPSASILQSCSMLVDISRIVTMKISSYNLSEYHQNTWIDVGIFIHQIPNLSSLIIQSSFYRYQSSQTIKNIHSIIPYHIKHLQVPVDDTEQIEMILERCKNLSTISFVTADEEFCKNIIQWFTDNTVNTSYHEDYKKVSLWLGKTNDINSHIKRITVN